ncbi:tectonin beta-propeller repeat-containing protein 1-like [Patiria miniata]|uniref:Uncharacterized protein n=1 Tax=Patiria miniata TaxID=46514 RepID=A0A913ZT45_PATMI|nr:tectonin beta-propeller repeat-containing protein 1-like [Patiria miniata]
MATTRFQTMLIVLTFTAIVADCLTNPNGLVPDLADQDTEDNAQPFVPEEINLHADGLNDAADDVVSVSESWTKIPGVLRDISSGYCGVWGTNYKSMIYYRHNTYGNTNSFGDNWIQDKTGNLETVSVGYNSVWGFNAHRSIFYRNGISASKPMGTSWVSVSGIKALCLSVSQKGHVWAVGGDAKVYHRKGASNTNIAGTSWVEISGPTERMDIITVGEVGVWVRDVQNSTLFNRKGTFGDPSSDPDGSEWVASTEGFFLESPFLSSGVDRLYAGNYSYSATSYWYDVWYLCGVSASKPMGKKWVKEDEAVSRGLYKLSYHKDVAWGLSFSDHVYAKSVSACT